MTGHRRTYGMEMSLMQCKIMVASRKKADRLTENENILSWAKAGRECLDDDISFQYLGSAIIYACAFASIAKRTAKDARTL